MPIAIVVLCYDIVARHTNIALAKSIPLLAMWRELHMSQKYGSMSKYMSDNQILYVTDLQCNGSTFASYHGPEWDCGICSTSTRTKWNQLIKRPYYIGMRRYITVYHNQTILYNSCKTRHLCGRLVTRHLNEGVSNVRMRRQFYI